MAICSKIYEKNEDNLQWNSYPSIKPVVDGKPLVIIIVNPDNIESKVLNSDSDDIYCSEVLKLATYNPEQDTFEIMYPYSKYAGHFQDIIVRNKILAPAQVLYWAEATDEIIYEYQNRFKLAGDYSKFHLEMDDIIEKYYMYKMFPALDHLLQKMQNSVNDEDEKIEIQQMRMLLSDWVDVINLQFNGESGVHNQYQDMDEDEGE